MKRSLFSKKNNLKKAVRSEYFGDLLILIISMYFRHWLAKTYYLNRFCCIHASSLLCSNHNYLFLTLIYGDYTYTLNLAYICRMSSNVIRTVLYLLIGLIQAGANHLVMAALLDWWGFKVFIFTLMKPRFSDFIQV